MLTMIVDFFRFWINIVMKGIPEKRKTHEKLYKYYKTPKIANRCSQLITSNWIYSLVKNKGVKLPFVAKIKISHTFAYNNKTIDTSTYFVNVKTASNINSLKTIDSEDDRKIENV